jgi:transposase
MSKERLSMRKLTEILRLNAAGLSARQIARSCGVARSTVAEYLERLADCGLDWPLPPELTEEQLEDRLFGQAQTRGRVRDRPMPEWPVAHKELQRRAVTLKLLWDEYRTVYPCGYGYSQYCQLYRDWLGKQAISLRQEHRAGEKLFVDYAGDTIPIHNRLTGTVMAGHLFVAVLGCSNYTYAEVTASEQLPDWIGAQVRALEYIRGVPQVVVPDNAKALVTSPCRYDPDINRTYQELAEHYGFAVIPARPRKPKDKAKVEAGVLIAERWILARLRHHTFFALAEVNVAVTDLLTQLNRHLFKKLPGCRYEVWEQMDRPALQSLPEQRYELAEWKEVGVSRQEKPVNGGNDVNTE